LKRQTLGLALALTGAIGGVAHAQDTAVDRDLRCAAVISYFYLTEEEPSDEGLRAVLYFIGRVQAHEPAVDIRVRLPQAFREMGERLLEESGRCAEVFSNGVDPLDPALRALGEVIQEAPKP
jgi:hypothetical protein